MSLDDFLDGVGGSEQSEVASESNQEDKKRIAELENKLEEAIREANKNGGSEVGNGEAGKPLLVNIGDVIENPDEPNTRTINNEDYIKELTANIKTQFENGGQGVQDPISVKWSEKYEKWIINKGHTRRLCAEKAGLERIPIIIQDDSTDWNQVIENILRENLPTKDLVNFVAKKKAEGCSNKKIGEMLSKNSTWVSKHVALSDVPAYVQSVWDSGYATDYNVLYEIFTCYKKDEEFTTDFLNSVISKKKEIVRADVLELHEKLKSSDDNEDNQEEDDQSTEAEETKDSQKDEDGGFKTVTKLLVETSEGKQGHLLIEKASIETNLRIELIDSSEKVEEPASTTKIIGIVEIEV